MGINLFTPFSKYGFQYTDFHETDTTLVRLSRDLMYWISPPLIMKYKKRLKIHLDHQQKCGSGAISTELTFARQIFVKAPTWQTILLASIRSQTYWQTYVVSIYGVLFYIPKKAKEFHVLPTVCISVCCIYFVTTAIIYWLVHRRVRKTAERLRHDCLPVRPPSNKSAPTGRIVGKFDIWQFFPKIAEKIQVSLNSDKKSGCFAQRHTYLW